MRGIIGVVAVSTEAITTGVTATITVGDMASIPATHTTEAGAVMVMATLVVE